jgi:hypothetical protein
LRQINFRPGSGFYGSLTYVIGPEAESELKYAFAHLREGAAKAAIPSDTEATTAAVGTALKDVIDQWRRLCGQRLWSG